MGHAKLYGSRSRYPRVALASDALTQQFHNPLPKNYFDLAPLDFQICRNGPFAP
jgi:hypothetical protein